MSMPNIVSCLVPALPYRVGANRGANWSALVGLPLEAMFHQLTETAPAGGSMFGPPVIRWHCKPVNFTAVVSDALNFGDVKRLRHYRKEWDDDHVVWKDRPRHDSSHGADAFLTYACSGYEPPRPIVRQQRDYSWVV